MTKKTKATDEAVLKAMAQLESKRRPLTTTLLAECLGLPQGVVLPALKRLVARGEVSREGLTRQTHFTRIPLDEGGNEQAPITGKGYNKTERTDNAVYQALAKLVKQAGAVVSTPTIADSLGISPSIARMSLARLTEAGLVQRTGAARHTSFQLPPQVSINKPIMAKTNLSSFNPTQLTKKIISTLIDLWKTGIYRTSPDYLAKQLKLGYHTIYPELIRLESIGYVVRSGTAKGAKFQLPDHLPPKREGMEALRRLMLEPLSAQMPSTYSVGFVTKYIPNTSSLLPKKLADELFSLGHLKGKLPACAYANKVKKPMMVDLVGASSYLEGYSATRQKIEQVFKKGASRNNRTAVMLLNHKDAIELLITRAPFDGLTIDLLARLHAVLMRALVPDTVQLGTVRHYVENLTHVWLLPWNEPSLLDEMLSVLIAKACLIANPVEAAFFLWVNLGYLQPFDEGNKPISRLSANIPLLLGNCAPLSFIGVDWQEYMEAMLDVQENNDVGLAVKLFNETYRRSIQKYGTAFK